MRQALKKDRIGLLEGIFDVKPAHIDNLQGPVQGIISTGHKRRLRKLRHDLQRRKIKSAAQQQHGAAPKAPDQHRSKAFPIQKRHHAHQHHQRNAHADIALVQCQRAHHEHSSGEESPLRLLPAEYRQHRKQQRQHIAVEIVHKGGDGR